MERLIKLIRQIDGKGYKAYKDLVGHYTYRNFTLDIDYVQGDPFAAPSRIRLKVPLELVSWPRELWNNTSRRIGLQDFLIRLIAQQIKTQSNSGPGTGKSGIIYIDCGGQEILERTALRIEPNFLEVRLSIGLPAMGRKILGPVALKMFTEQIPAIMEKSVLAKQFPITEAQSFVELKEDQAALRDALIQRKLVAFIANGAVLPRESGISDRPLRGQVISCQSPPEYLVEINLPNRGEVSGMGIPHGVTLIVGGGYQGKSTLLKAIERGVYDHIPGDGRELAITREDAVKIRAEDGRRVEKVNISPFIKNLPFGGSTNSFTTEDASGSTSQAANIMEAVEIGTSLLLLDEDTSATNFMIRDARMQELVAKDKEPIIPFVDKVQKLYQEHKISTILVMGGSGDYFDVADHVILLDEYIPYAATQQAKDIARAKPTHRQSEGGPYFGRVAPRVPLKRGFQPERGHKVKVDAKGLFSIIFGGATINLNYIEQLLDPSQTRAIAAIIYYLSRKYVDNQSPMSRILEDVYRDLTKEGLEVISPYHGQHPGDYAMPRKQEVAAAMNRLRTLMIK